MISSKLKELREAKGWGPSILAVESGVSRSTIHAVEAGKVRKLRAATAKALADALGVTRAELLDLADVRHFTYEEAVRLLGRVGARLPPGVLASEKILKLEPGAAVITAERPLTAGASTESAADVIPFPSTQGDGTVAAPA